jgi:membrane protease YdiL (CAAX protease family)
MSTRHTTYNDTLQKEGPNTTRAFRATAAPAGDTGVTAQYTLPQILGIWAAAALPMGLLGWVVAPALTAGAPTSREALTIRVMVLTAGLVWQFVLAMLIVYREEGDLRWTTIRRRLWLNTPRDATTGQPRGRLWLWLVPLLLLIAVWEIALHAPLDQLWVNLFPSFAEPAGFSGRELFASQEVRDQLVDAWGFLALFAVNALFNTFLGEELLLRGVLLPKMRGVFGKWDWLANGVLFGLYHLHQPWGIPGNIVSAVFLEAYPTRRFRSVWIAIIVHSGQSVYFLFLLLGLVLGLA